MIKVAWFVTSAPSKPAKCASNAPTNFKMTIWTTWDTRRCTGFAETVWSAAAFSEVSQHLVHTFSSLQHLLFYLMEEISFYIGLINWNALFWVSFRTTVSMGTTVGTIVFVEEVTRSLQDGLSSYVECFWNEMATARSYAANATAFGIICNSWRRSTQGTALTQWAAVTQGTRHRLK